MYQNSASAGVNEPVREGAVAREMHSLEGALEHLEKCAAELAQRTGAIRHQRPPVAVAGGDGKAPMPSSCPLSNHIAGLRARLAGTGAALDEILGTLEL